MRWTGLLTVLIGIFFLSSCSDPVKRYKILSFFFDGVPEPRTALRQEKHEEKTTYIANILKQKKTVEHGPYAAKICHGCHKRDTNELLTTVEKLCLNCHPMEIENKWVHGPIAAGGCRVCHMPHSSGYAFLLVADAEEFCFYCHNRADVINKPYHQDTKGCLGCHDAHSGDNRLLLRSI